MDLKQVQAQDAEVARLQVAQDEALRGSAQPGAAPPQPQYGDVGTMFASGAHAFRSTYTGQLIELGQTTLADLATSKEDLLTKAQYDGEFGKIKGSPRYYPGMSRASAQLRLEHWATDRMNDSAIDVNSPYLNFGASVVGQALDVTNYLSDGLGMLSKSFEAGSIGARTFGMAEKVTAPGKFIFNTEEKVMRAGMQARYNMGKTFMDGTTAGGIQTLGTYNLANKNDYEFTTQDMVQNLVMVPIFSAAFSSWSGLHTRMSPDTKAIASDTIARHSDAGSTPFEVQENLKANLGVQRETREFLARSSARAQNWLRGRKATAQELWESITGGSSEPATSGSAPGDTPPPAPVGDQVKAAYQKGVEAGRMSRWNRKLTELSTKSASDPRVANFVAAMREIKDRVPTDEEVKTAWQAAQQVPPVPGATTAPEGSGMARPPEQLPPPEGTGMARFGRRLKSLGQLISGTNRPKVPRFMDPEGKMFLPTMPINKASTKPMTAAEVGVAYKNWINANIVDNVKKARITEALDKYIAALDDAQKKPGLSVYAHYLENAEALRHVVISDSPRSSLAVQDMNTWIHRAVDNDTINYFISNKNGVKARVFGGKSLKTPESPYLAIMRQFFNEHRNQLADDYKAMLKSSQGLETQRLRRLLIEERSESAAQLRKRGALTNDQSWIADAYKRMFGIDVHFFDDATSKEAGVYGYFSHNNPNKIYVRSSDLFGDHTSMMGVAGHELGHWTSHTKPKVWLDTVDAMLDAGVNPIVKDAYLRTAHNHDGDKNPLWRTLPDAAKFDEISANVLGRAIQTKEFWRSLYKHAPDSAETLRAEIKVRAEGFSALVETKSKAGKMLAEGMGKALATAEGERTAKVSDENLLYRGGYAYYGERHLDFLHALEDEFQPEDIRRSLPQVGEGKFRRRMTLSEFNHHFRDMVQEDDSPAADGQSLTLNDRSGTPDKPGKYDVLNFRWRPNPEDVRNTKDQRAAYIFNVVLAKSKDPVVVKLLAAWKANRGKKWYEQAHFELQKFDSLQDSPLIRIIPQDDGSYKIGILTTDHGPIVQIDRLTQNEIARGLQTKVMQGFTDQLSKAMGRLNEILWDMHGNKAVKFDPENLTHWDPLLREFLNSDEGQDVINEFNRTAGQGPGAKLFSEGAAPNRSPKDTMLDSFLQAYSEWAQRKGSEALRKSGLHVAAEDRIHSANILAQWDELPDFIHAKKMKAEVQKLEDAWKEVVKAGNKLEPKDPNRKPVYVTREQLQAETDPETVVEQFNQHVKDRYQEILRDQAARILPSTEEGMTIERLMHMIEQDPKAKQAMMDLAERRTMEWAPGGKRAAALNKAINDNAKSWSKREDAILQSEILEQEATESGQLEHDDSQTLISPPEEYKSAADTFQEQYNEGSGMARGADETPEQASERFFKMSMMEENKVRLKLEHLRVLSEQAMERDHAAVKAWNEDYEGQAHELITKALDAYGIKLGTDDATLTAAILEAKLTKGQTKQVRVLAGLRDNLDANLHMIDQFAANAGNLDREMQGTYQRNLRRLEGNVTEAIKATRSDYERAGLASMVQTILDDRAVNVLKALEKQGVQHVKSFLDGLPYKGVVTPGESVNGSRVVLREKVQSRLINVIEKLNNEIKGFRNLWLSDELSKALELHQHGQFDGSAELKAAFDQILKVMHTSNETLVGHANSMGSNIRLADNYLWSHIHNRVKISATSLPEFITRLQSMLDAEKMVLLHGSDWNLEQWATQFYHEITRYREKEANPLDPMSIGNNLADPKGLHMTMFFKPGMASEYNRAFGSGHTASLIMSQMGRRAEHVGIMQMLGPNYELNWNTNMTEHGGAKWSLANRDRWTADITFRHILGFLDTPRNVKIAEYGRAIRNWMNSAMSWLSGISSITDFGNLNTAVRYMGGSDSHTVGEMLLAMQRHARRDSTYAEWMRGQGSGLTTLVQQYSRTLDGMGLFARAAQWASNKTFEYNGLELSGRAVQGAYTELTSRIAGDTAYEGNPTPAFNQWRKINNISDKEWGDMIPHARQVDGLEGWHLTPDMIPDAALARKLHMAQRSGMDYALLQPSISTEALLRLGTQAGTFHGEMVRTLAQYKSYPIDVVRRIGRRFSNGYAENGLSEKLIWVGSMLGLATVAISIKDMTRGTAPLNPTDPKQWNWANASRVMGQATVGPLAVGESLVTGKAPGPFVGGVGGTLSSIARGKPVQATTRAFSMMPGATAPGVTAMFRTFLQHVRPEVYQDEINRIYTYNYHRTGQKNILQK